MKKHVNILIFIPIILLSCTDNKKKDGEYQIITYKNLQSEFTDTLHYPVNNSLITELDLFIEGNIIGKGSFFLERSPSQYDKILLSGIVNENYKTEWYQNKFVIKYIPEKYTLGDSLILKYRIR